MKGDSPKKVKLFDITLRDGSQSKELQDRPLKGADPISVRPAELIPPLWPELEKKFPGLSDEDLLIHAIFPHEAPGYFEDEAKARLS